MESRSILNFTSSVNSNGLFGCYILSMVDIRTYEKLGAVSQEVNCHLTSWHCSLVRFVHTEGVPTLLLIAYTGVQASTFVRWFTFESCSLSNWRMLIFRAGSLAMIHTHI